MCRPRVLMASAVVVAALLACAIGGLATRDVLCLAPALPLVCILFARRYPGARLLTRFAARRRDRRPRALDARRSPRVGEAGMPRGGLLMGFSLAVRPPPACFAAS